MIFTTVAATGKIVQSVAACCGKALEAGAATPSESVTNGPRVLYSP